MKKGVYVLIMLAVLSTTVEVGWGQLLDNYDGIGGLQYDTSGVWIVANGQLEAQTGGKSTPEHSYASYDLSLSNANWSLSKDKQNEWIGWMDLNHEVISGWGRNNYSCGLVLAANNSVFNADTTKGYAVGFRDSDDQLVIFRFGTGIVSGKLELPGTDASTVLESGYKYSDSDKGVNFYVKLESDGRWTIKYKRGSKLSDEAAINPLNYSDSSVTSISAEETYFGPDYKYSGWIYAHSTSSEKKAYFDNFGIGTTDQSLPVSLTSFTAQSRNQSVVLSWMTESEIENLGFIIQKRLPESDDWLLVADYTTCEALAGHGSTSEAHEYSYTDAAVVPGATYSYRLGDVDYKGKVTWHKEVEVKVEAENAQVPLVFGLKPAYPNPFNPSVTIPYSLPEDGQLSLKIYNVRGQLVETLVSAYALKGAYSINWQPVNLSAGVYLVRLESGKKTNMQKVVFVK